MNYSAILFDLDGTLVDSPDLWKRAIMEMFEEVGVRMTDDDFRKHYAPSPRLSVWLNTFGIDAAREPELRERRDAHYIRLLREQLSWLPGAKELLTALHGTVPLGMVTGSWMTYVDAVDERLGVKAFFETIVTEDTMKPFSKPHPHGLFIAADRLGVEPRKCVYVGDMQGDLEAAHAAGMPCCIVRGTYTAQSAIEHAEHAVLNLGELLAVLVAK